MKPPRSLADAVPPVKSAIFTRPGRVFAWSLIEDIAALERLYDEPHQTGLKCSVCGHIGTPDDPVVRREDLPMYIRAYLITSINSLCENLGHCVSRRPNGERGEANA